MPHGQSEDRKWKDRQYQCQKEKCLHRQYAVSDLRSDISFEFVQKTNI